MTVLIIGRFLDGMLSVVLVEAGVDAFMGPYAGILDSPRGREVSAGHPTPERARQAIELQANFNFQHDLDRQRRRGAKA